MAIRSKSAVLGIVLLAVVAVDARAQDAITVAVGGRAAATVDSPPSLVTLPDAVVEAAAAMERALA